MHIHLHIHIFSNIAKPSWKRHPQNYASLAQTAPRFSGSFHSPGSTYFHGVWWILRTQGPRATKPRGLWLKQDLVLCWYFVVLTVCLEPAFGNLFRNMQMVLLSCKTMLKDWKPIISSCKGIHQHKFLLATSIHFLLKEDVTEWINRDGFTEPGRWNGVFVGSSNLHPAVFVLQGGAAQRKMTNKVLKTQDSCCNKKGFPKKLLYNTHRFPFDHVSDHDFQAFQKKKKAVRILLDWFLSLVLTHGVSPLERLKLQSFTLGLSAPVRVIPSWWYP